MNNMFTKKPIKGLKSLLLSLFVIAITACGGGSSTNEASLIAADNQCETSDNDNQNDNCGTLLLGLTDADGDFLTYKVDVTAIELTRQDGVQVSVMPTAQSVNFVDYIEISELMTAATLPAGVYLSGSITVDYSSADIQVEKAGDAVVASMVDEAGSPLLSQTLQMQFDETNPLVIARRRPAMLELDFNLAASHTVNLEAEPVMVETEPYIIAEVDPVMTKEFRIRGPLLNTNKSEDKYRIAVRPFHRKQGRFGGVDVWIDGQTGFEINGEAYQGSQGLAKMNMLAEGTACVALGIFDREQNRFTAINVIAGSGVPGYDSDAAKGVIVAREGNTLTLKGVSLIRQTGEVDFSETISVVIADTTLVTKSRQPGDEVSISDLSVGQAVTVLGNITSDDETVSIDASEGAVRMRLSFASGHTVSRDASELVMDLQALSGMSPEEFNFAGTGIDEPFDADPTNYEVSLDNLWVSNAASNDPLRISGYVSPFGSAPADFEAYSVINFTESRSQLYIDWPDAGGVAFSEITADSLSVNIPDDGVGGVYQLIQGGIRTALTSFEAPLVVHPKEERGCYTILNDGTVTTFSDFGEFTAYLQTLLDEGKSIDNLHSMGGFSSDTMIFNALKIALNLN